MRLQSLQVQPLLQVVDFFSSYVPTRALVGFCFVFA